MEGFDYTVPNNGMGNYNQPENGNNESVPGFFKQFPYAFNPQKYGELVRTKSDLSSDLWYCLRLCAR